VGLLASMVGLHGSGLPLTIPLNNVKYLGPLQHSLLDTGVLTVGLRSVYDELTRPLISGLLLDIALIAIAVGAPNVYQLVDKYSPALTNVKSTTWRWLTWKPSLGWAAAVAALLFFAAQRFEFAARFLYFQF
jgi:hypothetical protein